MRRAEGRCGIACRHYTWLARLVMQHSLGIYLLDKLKTFYSPFTVILRNKMSIIVRPLSDIELHRACIIEGAAYADSDLNPILFPGPFAPDSQQKRVDQLIQMRKDDPTAVYLQAIDTASGRMIASAKWHIYKTPEETQIPIRKLEFGPGTNPEACKAFFGGMMEKKKEIMGTRPHICTL